MSSYLGVDAGGSKTTVVLADTERVLTVVTGPPGAVRPGRALVAASRIALSVRRALTEARLLEADVLVVGAAGVGREPEQSELYEGLRGERLATRLVVTGDLDIALEAAFGNGPGIVVVSGTGSVALARGPDGVLHRQGGYGWQMGDEGSGYALGRAALLAVSRARDGRGDATRLSELLPAAVSRNGFDELLRWSATAEPGEIAALAPTVLGAAAVHDAVAERLVADAVEQLFALVSRLATHFDGKAPIPLALAGGNLDAGRGLRAPLTARLRQLARLVLREEPLDPAEGAVALARRLG